ncbi:hypothetical protein, partial [Streptomyces sp. NPDC048565]|uniref:hypothetical protein n=1 Tax=Streptomyces sp. NPDC048565 TaxID=3155266 RepID=UPI003445DA74
RGAPRRRGRGRRLRPGPQAAPGPGCRHPPVAGGGFGIFQQRLQACMEYPSRLCGLLHLWSRRHQYVYGGDECRGCGAGRGRIASSRTVTDPCADSAIPRAAVTAFSAV